MKMGVIFLTAKKWNGSFKMGKISESTKEKINEKKILYKKSLEDNLYKELNHFFKSFGDDYATKLENDAMLRLSIPLISKHKKTGIGYIEIVSVLRQLGIKSNRYTLANQVMRHRVRSGYVDDV